MTTNLDNKNLVNPVNPVLIKTKHVVQPAISFWRCGTGFLAAK